MKGALVLDQNSFMAIVGLVSGVVFAYLGYQKGLKKDSYSDGADRGTLKNNIDHIMKRTDDILLEQRDTNNKLNNLSERVARVEESAKSAHKRIDTIEGGE